MNNEREIKAMDIHLRNRKKQNICILYNLASFVLKVSNVCQKALGINEYQMLNNYLSETIFKIKLSPVLFE